MNRYGRGTLREGQNNKDDCKHRTNIKLSPCLIKHHINYVTYGSGGMAPCILKLGSKYRSIVSFMCQSYPNKISPITHRTVSWAGPRIGVHTMKRIHLPLPRIPQPSRPDPKHYTDSATPAPSKDKRERWEKNSRHRYEVVNEECYATRRHNVNGLHKAVHPIGTDFY
jgi:hypothetical protein